MEPRQNSAEKVDTIEGDVKIFFIDSPDNEETRNFKAKPHRHAYQEIIFVEKGTACHRIDGEEYQIESPVVILVAQGKIHAFVPHPNMKAYVVRFTDQFITNCEADLFSQFFALSKIPLNSPESQEKIHGLFQMMLDEFSSEKPNKSFLRHLLQALIELLRDLREKKLCDGKVISKSNYELFGKFLQQLEKHFTEEHTVEFYASNLNITPKKLGIVCKEIFGDSPSRIIEKRLTLEAKRLLMYTSQSVAEITFALGFNDQSYFTKAFRKNEGVTPTAFRERNIAA
ncbi:MAG: AraC family transcriptional regulator [Chitinophagales bacterium]